MSRRSNNAGAMKRPYVFKDNTDGGEPARPCRFSCRADGGNLLFEFRVSDGDIYCPYGGDNEDLWRGDAVGVLSPDGRQNDYYEFEAAPNGARFFSVTHLKKDDPRINPRVEPPFFSVYTERTGDGYRIRMTIPAARLEGFDMGKARFNALCLDYGSDGRLISCQSLNPTFCETVHVPKRFLGLSKKLASVSPEPLDLL
ncbi:MAG: hypothetical protein LBL66_01430 [Clostridiales bacterium]|jgi:hypothetical protein|nr:hypothetical protein [Clostridiales bacterium]